MGKPDINNYEELLQEKERLKVRLQMSKAKIGASFNALKDELNPYAAIGGIARNTLKGNTTNPLVKFGIKRSVEFFIGKVLLKRAGWLPRLVVPFVVREATTRMVGRKIDKKLAALLRKAAASIRETEIPSSITKK